jgi:membrane protease YdiL (CAAX protease family)
MLALFLALPIAISLFNFRAWVFPILWLGSAICIALLLLDKSFDRRQFWNARALRSDLPRILILYAAVVVIAALALWFFFPERFLSFPRERPRLYALVMVLYPLLSAYPQNLVYRTFFLHRYAPLFSRTAAATPALILASAVAFSLAHLSFHNQIAIIATFAGGILFAITYTRTRSTFAASFEHALYGCAIFTLGLGSFFFHGAARP